MRSNQDVYAKSEQDAIRQQATAAIGSFLVAEETEYLPYSSEADKEDQVTEKIFARANSGEFAQSKLVKILAQGRVVLDQEDRGRQQDKPYSRKQTLEGRSRLNLRSNNQDHDQVAQRPDPSLETPCGKIGPKQAEQSKTEVKHYRPTAFEHIQHVSAAPKDNKESQ